MPSSRAGADLFREPDLRDYLRMVWRKRRIIAVIVAAAVLGAVGASLASGSRYEASATLVLQEQSQDPFNQTPAATLNPDRTVQTELEVFDSSAVRDRVKKLVGADPGATVSALGQTNAFSVTVGAGRPGDAATLANAYAQAYVEVTREQAQAELRSAALQLGGKIDDLKRQIADLDSQPPSASIDAARDSLVTNQALFQQKLDQLEVSISLQTGRATITTSATAPTTPVYPRPLRSAVLALVVGLILGLGIALLLEFLDDSVISKADLEAALLGAPVLATIPAIPGWKDSDPPRVQTLEKPSSPASEAYRSLRTAVQFLGLERDNLVVAVSSPRPGEGKTTTAVNLAVLLAGASQRVCLVCCDLRRPRVHEFFDMDNEIGLTSVLTGAQSIEDALQAIPDVAGMDLLASGPLPPNPAEVLGSNLMRKLLVDLRDRFDVVVLDCPPLLPVTDAVVLAPQTDAVLVVARAGRTRADEAERAADALRQVGIEQIGGVLNATTAELGGYGYGYGAATPAEPQKRART